MGEAVAVKDKKGKCGRKNIEIRMSRRSLKGSFSFRRNATNVRDRQLVKDILVNIGSYHVDIQVVQCEGFHYFRRGCIYMAGKHQEVHP